MFGGPDNVEQQLEEDARDEDSLLDQVFFEPYFGFKERVRDTLGLGFGLDYSTALFSVSASPGEDHAAGGMVRLYGAWALVREGTANSGSLVYKGEHRHRYTTLAPKDLSFDFGYAGLIAPPFSDQQTRLTNLYWRQRFAGGRISVVGGFLDTTDYVDVYALASPWLHFQNLAFSTGSATIPLPDDATFGVAGAAMVTNNLYVIAGIADTNANAADPFRSAENFFTASEHFTHLEVGWTSSQQRIIFDNVHVTFWHADEREKAQVPDGWGINYSASTFLNESFMPFVRGGYAKDGGSLLQQSLSVGLGYFGSRGSDLVGAAYNWGEPNEATFAPDLTAQHGLELFYRLQVTDELAVTPSLEYLRNPALDPGQNSIWLLGLRARFAL